MSPLCPRCGLDHAGAACALLPTQMSVAEVSLAQTRLEGPEEAAESTPEFVELAPGTLVGEYGVVRKIGEGGMGMVFEAVHPLIGRKVAIKVINAFAGSSEGAASRFLQEARTATMLRHRNIVDVFAFGQLRDGRSYLVMEFLEGETLSAYLDRRGPLSLQEAMPILEGVFAGLATAHARGVVHRDLKPDNIWILPPELDAPIAHAAPPSERDANYIDPQRVKLLDFGIAKIVAGEGAGKMLTRAGTPMGTPAFMSPEQCRGDATVDARTDIYALGVILYEMFTLEYPFPGATFIEVLNLHLTAPPPSLEDAVGMPEELAEVIYHALAKSPAERFASVADLHAALLACTAARDWSPRPAATPGSSRSAPDDETLSPSSVPPVPSGRPPASTPRTLHGGRGARSLETGTLRIDASLDGGTLTLLLRGEVDDGEEMRALAAYLGEVIEATQEVLDRVVLDVGALDFLGVHALSCIADWLGFLCEARVDGLAPTTVRYDQSLGWQRTAMSSLQRVDPALRLEAVG